MIQALALAFKQLGDKRIQFALLWTIVLALVASALLIAGASVMFAVLEFSNFIFIGWALALLGSIAAAFVAWMLFPVLAAELHCMFVDRVVDAVEARHYPHLAPAKQVARCQYINVGLRFTIVMAFFNLVILPLSFVPGLQAFYAPLYFTINGALLGRKFFEVVALRRINSADARKLQRRQHIKLFVSGIVIALLFTVPLVNLIAPIVATAFMVHIFHGLPKSDLVPSNERA